MGDTIKINSNYQEYRLLEILEDFEKAIDGLKECGAIDFLGKEHMAIIEKRQSDLAHFIYNKMYHKDEHRALYDIQTDLDGSIQFVPIYPYIISSEGL